LININWQLSDFTADYMSPVIQILVFEFIFASSTSVLTPGKESLIMSYRKFTARFSMSLR